MAIDNDKELRTTMHDEYVDITFNDLEKYHSGRITSEKIYATVQSFQNFNNISKIMKKILQFDNKYYDQITDKSKNSVEFNTNHSKKSYLQKIKIDDLFNIRYNLVHTLSKKRLNIFMRIGQLKK